MKTCKLCGNEAEVYYTGNGWIHVRCSHCGPYKNYDRTPVDEKYNPILAEYLFDIDNRSANEPFELTWGKITSILAEREAL